MTALAERLRRRIALEGPITIADYMADCLLHPVHGYYATRDPLGAAGDFTTAPEISQMFGEMIGLALAQVWVDQGRPAPVTLAELGPGRGTLMADILRATGAVPGFRAAVEVHLVEASPALRAVQADTLAGAAPVWHDTVDSLPDAPTLAVANEFFDALPVRQFQRDGAQWRERVVGLSDGALALGLAAPTTLPTLAAREGDVPDGGIVELRPAAAPVMATLAERIGRLGGAALVVDYGDAPSNGDTFQAVRGHAPADPLAAPGAADLTAHVDFAALAQAARSGGAVAVAGPLPQGAFLERLGITARANALLETLEGPAREAHVAAHRRLTHPAEMGSLFKCLALTPRGRPPFPGFPHDP